MTIIAVKDGIMAADSAAFQNDLMFSSPEPKIVRTSDGGLVGACGALGDCHILRLWVRAGMNFEVPPKFSHTEVSSTMSVLWLWLKPDLTIKMGDCTMNNWFVPGPTVIGCGTDFLHGLLDGGVDLAEAVRRTIIRTPYLGGEVQVECLSPTARTRPGDILEVPSGWPPDASRTLGRTRAWADYWQANPDKRPNGSELIS